MNHGNCGLADIVESYSRILLGWHPNTHAHCERVGVLCRRYADYVGMDQEAADLLVLAARIHDLGKIGIPIHSLDKVTALSSNEYEAIQSHPAYAHHYMQTACLPAAINHVLLCHHENYDGTGYPAGLAGDEIPEPARIVRVPDSIDAIMYARAYHGGIAGAKEVIRKLRVRAKHYDPHVLAVFIELLNDG